MWKIISMPISYQFHLEFNLRTTFVGGFSAGLAALSHSKFYAKVHMIVGFISVADISCYIGVSILYKVIDRVHGHQWRRKFRILKTNATSLIIKLTISFINNWIMQWTGATRDAHTDIRALRSPYWAVPCWWKILYLKFKS